MHSRSKVDISKIKSVMVPDKYGFDRVKKLHGNLVLPSYVHGYSLGIEYMHNWFRKGFDKDYFKGGIYIEGKHVLDDYTRLNNYSMRNIVKGQNPRARIGVEVDHDYDREGLDLYQAPPEVFLKRSKFQDAFFKDYERDMFLGFMPRGIRMNFNFKVRVNTKSQQLDVFNSMELNFRNGATQHEYLSADFHVPKHIMLYIANKAGFEIIDEEVVDIIEFIQYLNAHSDIPFLYKLRAINQQCEFFIRVNNLYTHIAVRDKLSVDNGERDGKLDYNFHVEMTAILEMPIPHYYAFYSPEPLQESVIVTESANTCVAIYSMNLLDIPLFDEHGWNHITTTDYSTDVGDTEMDLSPIFGGDNSLARAINHDLTLGISPAKYINIKVYHDEDIARDVPIKMDWKRKTAVFLEPISREEILHIAMYYDKQYINELDIELRNLKENRIGNK